MISGVTVEPWPARLPVTTQAWLTTAALRCRRLVTAQAHSLGLPAVMPDATVRDWPV